MSELSPKALKLILDYEVGGGEEYYNSQLKHPTWPGGESGVTIGIGYDLGYTPRARFLGDWHALEDSVRDRLAATIGVRGLRARERAKEVRDITIPWPVAFEVFQRATIPFWIGQTRGAFPGLDALPWDAAGALVSLVFNRGPAMEGDRRREMVRIRSLVAENVKCGMENVECRRACLAGIAKQLRAMKRLWYGKGLDGLLRRRDAEAGLVENADCGLRIAD